MHHIHIARLTGESHDDVYYYVEDSLFQWGKREEGFTILGSLCKEDQSFSDEFDEEWFKKDEILNNPELFNDMLHPDRNEISGLNVIKKGVQNAVDYELLWVSKYYEHQFHLSQLSNPNKLDIWNDEYRRNSFHDCGLTEFESEGPNTYLVFIQIAYCKKSN